jgi:hypothetical protein
MHTGSASSGSHTDERTAPAAAKFLSVEKEKAL